MLSWPIRVPLFQALRCSSAGSPSRVLETSSSSSCNPQTASWMSLQVQATCELRLHRDHFEFAIRDFLGQAQCMDIIGLGEGPRLAAWIEAARVHPDVRSIAVVSRHEPATEVGIEVRRYSTLQSACKEIKPSVALLTGAAALDGRQAVEALEQGMDIILDRPDTLDLLTLMKLTELA